MKFNDAVQRFLNHVQVTRSDGTYRFQRQKTVALLNFFGDIEVTEINKFLITDFIAFMKNRNPDISHATINKHLNTLERIVRYVSDRRINYEKLPTIKKKKNILSTLTVERVFLYYDKLMKSKEHKDEALRNYVMFRLILDNGVRINELLHIKMNDIDFESNIIHLKHTKTNSERYIFFTDFTKSYLKLMIITNQITDRIFINYRQKKPLTVDNVEKICQRLQKRLKLNSSVSPHIWRHTFATLYIKKGGTLEPLRQMLGHTSLKTTQQYLHYDTDDNHKEYFKIYGNEARSSLK